jgi:prefoldin beta subunit
MDTQIPKQLQDKIAQFQTLQSQLQMISMQKQQLFMQSADIENALKALEGVSDGKVYRAAGPLLIETGKGDSEKKLKDDKEVTATRLKMMEKQETKLTEKLDELRNELQTMMKPGTGAM